MYGGVKMKRRWLLGFLIVFVLTVLNTTFVFAAEFDETSSYVITISGGQITSKEFEYAFKTANLAFGIDRSDGLIVPYKNNDNVVAIEKGGVLYIDKNIWNNISKNQLAKSMHFFMSGLEAQENTTNKEAIITFMKDTQTVDEDVGRIVFLAIYSEFKADMTTTYNITKPAFGIVNIVFGVGAIILIVILLTSTVLDLAYIGLPIWREFDITNGGKPNVLISYDAVFVVKEKEKYFDNYTNVYLNYLLKRSWSYIVLAVCITYLIAGGFSDILSFILSLVSGFTSA